MWELPFVLAVLEEQLSAPRMPTGSYSCLEGQRDKPSHKAQGPLRWGAVGERVLGVPALPPATPPSTAASFTLRPYVQAAAGFAMVQPPGAIIRGPQTSPGPGTQLRPRKGNSEVGTDLRPQVAPSLLVATCTEAWWLPVVPSELWQSGGLCSSLLQPSVSRRPGLLSCQKQMLRQTAQGLRAPQGLQSGAQ